MKTDEFFPSKAARLNKRENNGSIITFEKFEGQDEVSSEVSAFQWEELARDEGLSLALKPLQIVNISSLIRGVGFYCVLGVKAASDSLKKG